MLQYASAISSNPEGFERNSVLLAKFLGAAIRSYFLMQIVYQFIGFTSVFFGNHTWEKLNERSKRTTCFRLVHILTITYVVFKQVQGIALYQSYQTSSNILSLSLIKFRQNSITAASGLIGSYIAEYIFVGSMKFPVLFHHLVTFVATMFILQITLRLPHPDIIGHIWLFQGTLEQLTYGTLLFQTFVANEADEKLRISLLRLSALLSCANRPVTLLFLCHRWFIKFAYTVSLQSNIIFGILVLSLAYKQVCTIRAFLKLASNKRVYPVLVA